MPVEVKINSGICGFSTTVIAEKDESNPYHASFHIKSQCANWVKVEQQLGGVSLNVMEELFKNKETGKVQSRVIDLSLDVVSHVSCPVLSGILKSLEVSTGLALAGDADITFVS